VSFGSGIADGHRHADRSRNQTTTSSHHQRRIVRYCVRTDSVWLFVKQARLSFDPGFYKLAEQCAACLEARGSTGPEMLLLRAHVLQSLHHFSAAETAARELVKLRELPFDYGGSSATS
jgi:hypothetical protein